MRYYDITASIKRHLYFSRCCEILRIIDSNSKRLSGPQGRAVVAGGAISDMYGESIGVRNAGIKDIDVFVTHHDRLFQRLSDIGFKLTSEPPYDNETEKVARGFWKGVPIHLIQVSDVGRKLKTFDLRDRVAWCDGETCWAQDSAIQSIKRNVIQLNRLNTPGSTAVRIHKFAERFGATISNETMKIMRLANGNSNDEFADSILPYCEDRLHADLIASKFVESNP